MCVVLDVKFQENHQYVRPDSREGTHLASTVPRIIDR